MSVSEAHRTIGVVTTSRADYGHYRSVLRCINEHPSLELLLYVTGTHLSSSHGMTVRDIELDGFPIAERVEILLDSDTPSAIATSAGVTTITFARIFARQAPDILLVLGDRFEMFAAASAAAPFRIPLAHIAGGEVTRGANDDSYRHALTKLSHLHFATTDEHRRRILQLGEQDEAVFVVGSPSLDALHEFEFASRLELEQAVGLQFNAAQPVVVTFHPTSLADDPTNGIDELVDALTNCSLPVVITAPNADAYNTIIRHKLERFAASSPRISLVKSLGARLYFSLMSQAAVMVGNSSSGIIEAASFGLPVVNIGARQDGRQRSFNVIDVANSSAAIRQAIDQATSREFRATLRGMVNPYGDGHTGQRIADILSYVSLNGITQKFFQDR